MAGRFFDEWQVGDQRAERRVAHRYADHQAESVDAVDERLAEFALRGDLMIEMHRLRIVGEGRDKHIVGLGDGASD